MPQIMNKSVIVLTNKEQMTVLEIASVVYYMIMNFDFFHRNM